MNGKSAGKLWVRAGLIAIVLPLCFIFPYVLIVVLILTWLTFLDFIEPKTKTVLPPRTWVDAKPDDSDWLELFLKGCESPAEEKFLQSMVKEFNLYPSNGALISPALSMEMQFTFHNYRFDFVLNSKYIVEIDGATYHSSPEQVERDRIRDEFSVAHGYSVLRIPASIVFNNPAEAIRRVKDFALNPTRSATEPEPEPVAKNSIIRKPVSNYIGDFTKGVSSFTKIVIDASLKQATISDFKKAIDSEQIFLNAMVRKVETEIRLMNLSPGERKIHDEMYARITQGHIKKPITEIFCWTPIILPEPIDNEVVQRQISMECAYHLENRRKYFEDLRKRSANDYMFAVLFHKYMEESGFPDMDLIKSGAHVPTSRE
ncbi:DUF559 domain-containing protein [Pseudomonas sp. FSL R10-1350]|uniref:DUF559 domain-containing protein n=6 Tax=Pseudomonas helleri TaxID=1608996 RepID=A0A6A7ZIY2_9PSED|nr:DUF559 domain-containing protein [Pseudomonas helleri]EFB6649425.1 DUF559 domain-containing protein [Escherichia coli]MQT71290.1 DUF559 domain-containing protein [Pseudomonas sp. FSL R10-0071]MQT87500.1 DUF559 domain-containing protein [Pseudomonas sp. FSL R10-2964]MQU66465.1 DUF559 domain-containing protein [Pseudomonas sp. FSL R10-1350]MQT98523.1 DUF559 domain-containing protein [Pseudomonas helleri]